MLGWIVFFKSLLLFLSLLVQRDDFLSFPFASGYLFPFYYYLHLIICIIFLFFILYLFCYFILHIIALVRTYSKLMNRTDKNGHPSNYMGERNLSCSIMMLTVGLHRWPFFELRKSPLTLIWTGHFKLKSPPCPLLSGYFLWIDIFLHLLINPIVFLFLVWYYHEIHYELWILNQPCIPEANSSCTNVFLFIYYWTWPACISNTSAYTTDVDVKLLSSFYSGFVLFC